MPAKQKNYKLLKWIGGILLTLIVIISAVAIFFSVKWKPLITEKIKEGVYNGSAHLYKIDFSDIQLNLFTGTITLDNIKLTHDSTVYDSLKLSRRAPAHVFDVTLPKLQFSRVSLLTAYFKKRVEMNAIVLKNPSINMLYSKVVQQRDTSAVEKTLYQQIEKTLRSIHVKAIKIEDANFDYYNKARSSKPINEIKHLTVNVKDFLIDSLTQFDTTRVLYAKDINFELLGYTSRTKDKMYTLKVDSLTGSATAGFIKVKNLRLTPLYKDLEFSRKYATQKDRYDLSFEDIRMDGVNFRAFNNEGKLYLRKLSIGPAKVNVFMNRELPPPNFDKGRNFPHIALKRAPVETTIDSLQLRGVDVSYTEFSEQTKKRGTIVLKNLRGGIRNVTNDSLSLSKNSHAIADLQTNIMGTGKLAIEIDFDLASNKGAFSYKGSVGGMDLKILNPLSVNLGLVAIESGYVTKINFAANANSRGATGSLQMVYKDLKVNLLKSKDGEIKEKGLLSFLANSLLVIDSNPNNGKPLRSGKIQFDRPMTASFFNLLWKSIFTGIRESVGIGAVPMKKPPQPKK